MLDFGALPPEINSGRMYAGPGAGPLLAAAGAWDALAAELNLAAVGYNSVVSELTSAPWLGPASTSMAAAAAPYVLWLSRTATQAGQTAAQARAAAADYEAAFAMTVPPQVIAANRSLLMALIATNFFGQNTPAIMATEADYVEMWAQDAAAMYGYAVASTAASALTPVTPPPQTTSALAHAAVSGGTAATASSSTLPSWFVGPNGLLATMFGASSGIWTAASYSVSQGVLGTTNSLLAAAGGLLPGAPAPSPALGGALPITGWTGAGGLGGLGGSRSVAATVGQAETIGTLSVPQSWAGANPGVSPFTASSPVSALGGAAERSGPGGVLRGIPLTGMGRPGAGSFVHRYGFRHSVLSRPPSAG